ncbi:MAG: hypothetical protein HY962_03475 [Ignavibacteriae bacterium]|nr:hypothetical protein [Ignavibacteriota bacterium]
MSNEKDPRVLRPPFPNAEAIPPHCDFSCQYAAFGDPSAVGACRRDVGVWCKAAMRYNNKHARCLFGGETR